jgi:hypothetical protein
MIQPAGTKLFLAPGRVYVEAKIVSLTEKMADDLILHGWWDEECLSIPLDEPLPIDRHWNWNAMEIEFEGKPVESERIAIVAGDDGAVQGAMMISSEPVPSLLDRGKYCLFVELLFTAPRNRPNLRKDRSPFLLGVGTELLTWGVRFSREKGCEGRLRLDGSQDYLPWYERRGLQPLGLDPILFEGNLYTPMELGASRAQEILAEEG